MDNKKYKPTENVDTIAAEPSVEYGRVVECNNKEDFFAELRQKVDAGVKDIRQGKGISKKADETTEQFFERLCTE